MAIAELIQYAEAHHSKTPDDFMHKRLVQDISSKLVKLGIPDDAIVFSEVAQIADGRLIGAVDLMAIAEDRVYIIEAKTLDKHKARPGHTYSGIRAQLNKGYSFFSEMSELPITCIGVYRRSRARRFHLMRHNPPLFP